MQYSCTNFNLMLIYKRGNAMIEEITFNNYRFFSNSKLSFFADRRTKKLLSNSIKIDNRQILKTIALYGGNNSGKTNVIFFLRLLKRILEGRGIQPFNNAIFGDPKTTACSITYNNNDGNGWYKYSFTISNEKKEFLSERLSHIVYYDTGYPHEDILFDLDRESHLLKIFDADKHLLLDLIIGDKSIVYSIRTESGEFQQLNSFKESFKKLSESIEIVDLNNFPIDKTLDALKGNNEKKKKFIVSFVKHADLSIENFSYRKDIAIANNAGLIAEKAMRDLERMTDAFKLTTTYGKANVPSIFFDSAGTKKIEGIASHIYDALSEGKLLVIDEMDNGLHFMLTRAIVSLFNNIANEKAQLLFTAHDLLLIDCSNLLRKEQIYMISRKKDNATIYCLSESTVANTGLREGSDILKRYYKGEFGYVPSPTFISDLLSLRE